jgi:L-galactose dehydrogenase/L-glyceraldehyde 3-phosphate reductase
MRYRQLGRTGLEISEVGFGCGGIGGLFVRGTPSEQREAVEMAVAGGVNYFDTAALYGNGRSEENLGRVIGELDLDVVVGTKINLAHEEVSSADTAVSAKLAEGLRRLGRERVDVCTFHGRIGPPGGRPGGAASADEMCGPIAAGMRRAVEAGLAGAIGFTGLGDTAAVHQVITSGAFDYAQCYFNVLNPSAAIPGRAPPGAQDFDGIIARCAEAGMGVMAIRVFGAGAVGASPARHPFAGDPGGPLAGGDGYASDLARAARLGSVATELGLESPFELALRATLAETQVSTALVGFSDRRHVEEALRWQARGPLTDNELAQAIGGGDEPTG